MTRFGTAALAAASILAVATGASAGVLIDHGPSGTYQGTWVNTAGTQNFLVQIQLDHPTTINGFGVYTGTAFGSVGQAVELKIRPDVSGSPDYDAADQLSFYSVLDSLTAVSVSTGEVNLAVAHFTPIDLDPGLYWIGMSGFSELGWASFDDGGPIAPAYQYSMYGDVIWPYPPQTYDLAYQVLSDATPGVPEPATWAMMIAGFGMAGGALRRRRALVA
jgi:hypothetical protein